MTVNGSYTRYVTNSATDESDEVKTNEKETTKQDVKETVYENTKVAYVPHPI